MAVRDQIDSIISARKEKGKEVERRSQELQNLSKTLYGSYNDMLTRLKGIKDEELKKKYGALLGGININKLRFDINELVKSMDDGVTRFNRDYISIATVGKERQGKSRFLQSVGNLGNEIIPAFDGTSCTGATSVIWNDSSMQKGTVRADIQFRQPQELVDIVRPYIMELDPDYLNDGLPLTFDDIPGINTFKLEMHVEQGNAAQHTALEHLKDIVDHFYDIKPLFGAAPLTLTDANTIMTYVAQNNGKAEGEGQELYYKYLAVARADIHCPFYTDTGRLRLVDTVGIGDTKFGIEDAMLDTVDRECDAAIVVTKPISSVQNDDIALYNSLEKRFAARDTRQWLFYLVNHRKGDNDNVVSAFQKGIAGKWNVAGCEIVDNSDQDQVRDVFLMPMLQTLIHNMDAIDRKYIEAIDQKELKLRKEMREFIESLLLVKNVHLSEKYFDVVQSKGPKSRRVYISDGLASYLTGYEERIRSLYPARVYFFPANPEEAYSVSFMHYNFRLIWNQAFPAWEGKMPKIYDFRHHFAWSNINRWVREGTDVNAMLPYLMRYMGHNCIKHTLYYFRFVPDFYQDYRNISSRLNDRIPEVKANK